MWIRTMNATIIRDAAFQGRLVEFLFRTCVSFAAASFKTVATKSVFHLSSFEPIFE